MAKPELWEVVWDDAHGGTDDVSIEEAERFTSWRLTTVGWLVRKTKRGITLAMEYGPSETEFRTYTFIPSKYIVTKTKLDVSE